jgi:hypothetical protein
LEYCKNTGVSIPECSCHACLMRLISRHAPALLAGAAQSARPLRFQARAPMFVAPASMQVHRDLS